jgi:hypothetical protein
MKNQQLKRTTLNSWGNVLTVALLFSSSPLIAQQVTTDQLPENNPPIQNIFGGGDVQRDKLAIADLQVKTAQLESALAELERQKEEEKVLLGEKVLRLLLDIESSDRTIALIQSQQETFALQNEVFRIQYRFGQGSTEQLLGMTTRGDRLNEQLTAAQIERDGAVRELVQVTGLDSASTLLQLP